MRIFSLLASFLTLGLSMAVNAEWQLVYKNDPFGKRLKGDKTQLMEAVRLGLPIRIAWGATDPRDKSQYVEHVATPVFVTVASGDEVFVQIPEHVAQTSYWNREFQDFETPQVVWRGLLSTTGRFMAVWYNRANGSTTSRRPQRVTISWFVDSPSTKVAKAQPLFE